LTPPKLILASSSPRRKELLSQYGYQFEIRPADIQEVAPPHLSAQEIVLLNARLKCSAVAALFPGAVVLGVDTLVAFQDEVLGKPPDMNAAERMLERLNGNTHQVFSAVTLQWLAREVTQEFVVATQVTFRNLSPEDRRIYLHRIGPLDKAGAYAAQDDQNTLIARVEGSFSNVVGLPMETLAPTLAALNILPSR
jgi:septum formation protein